MLGERVITMAEFVRVIFELPQEKANELDLLMGRAGLKNRKDLINTALTLLQWVVEEQGRGQTIASLDYASRHYKELRIAGLSVRAGGRTVVGEDAVY